MEKLSKTSLNYILSEYLEDLGRAGVQDFYRPRESNASESSSGVSSVRPVPSAASSSAPSPTRRPVPPPIESRVATPIAFAPLNENQAPSSSETDAEERSRQLALVATDVAQCSRCAELVANRTQTVFGTGDPCAELVFIGEGPGAEEDLQGKPFVGRSGQLLTDMIEKGMGIPRSSVFICNIVRCRPPQNRNPQPDEAKACRPFLDATLKIVQPKFICCLGSISATNLLNKQVPIGKLRGIVHEYNGAKVVCTYHPAYLLRNPSAKKQAWEDLQLLMGEMGLSVRGK